MQVGSLQCCMYFNKAACLRSLFAGSMAPITAIQFGAHRVLDRAVTTATGRPLEGLQGIGVAIGALSCLTHRTAAASLLTLSACRCRRHVRAGGRPGRAGDDTAAAHGALAAGRDGCHPA